MVVDVAQEDRVTTFAGKVGRRLGAFQHDDIRQGVLRDGGSDLGELLRSDVRGVDASLGPNHFAIATDIAPPPAPTSATIIPGLSASSSASCGTSRAACSRSCRTAVAGRCDPRAAGSVEEQARNVCAAASQASSFHLGLFFRRRNRVRRFTSTTRPTAHESSRFRKHRARVVISAVPQKSLSISLLMYLPDPTRPTVHYT